MLQAVQLETRDVAETVGVSGYHDCMHTCQVTVLCSTLTVIAEILHEAATAQWGQSTPYAQENM